MESGIISNEQLAASANVSNFGVLSARLNGPSAWVGEFDNLTQWFKVAFRSPVLLTGVVLQGHPNANEWVTRYTVMISLDDVVWENVTDEFGITEVGNSFSNYIRKKHDLKNLGLILNLL